MISPLLQMGKLRHRVVTGLRSHYQKVKSGGGAGPNLGSLRPEPTLSSTYIHGYKHTCVKMKKKKKKKTAPGRPAQPEAVQANSI